MKKVNHHLTDALLMGYSAGTLPEAFNLVVATHISMCDECRAALAEFDAVGGEVMMAANDAKLSPQALQETLDKIANAPVDTPSQKSPKSSVFPTPLQSYVSGDLPDVKWKRIGGGVSQMVLKTSGDATVRLLRIPAGVAVPDHGHKGTELTLVLQGAFADDEDRFAAGDVEVANEDLVHTPTAEGGMDCICLAATDAPLAFKGFLPRMAQKFIGI